MLYLCYKCVTMKATADIYFDKRLKVDGTGAVKIKVTFNRQRKYFSTGLSVTPQDFEAATNGKRKTADQKECALQINHFINKADGILKMLPIFTFQHFEDNFFSNRNTVNSVFAAFDERIEELKAADKIGTAVTYECAKVSLQKFNGNKDLAFADVTVKFLNSYEKSMLATDKSRTTIGMYVRALRALFNVKNIDASVYPFGRNKYEIPSSRNVKKALTLEEIGRIFNYEAKAESWRQRARDYWIFLYLCNGMNVKDFCLLRWSDLNGNTITYNRAKTAGTDRNQKLIHIALQPEARAVIEKYGLPSLNKDAFIFPHLTRDMTAERMREVYQQVTQNINKNMKKIAAEIGITAPVTTYAARHSFATILKRSGANISMISDLLGHNSLTTTENYLAGFEAEQIREQTAVLTAFK